MTIERAIEILDPDHREQYDSIETVNDACRMGMCALEAQLPKKPKQMRIGYTGVRSGICHCGKHLEPSDNFCSNCGQAIDWWNWSEEDEDN